jgi:hypothetical protein
MLKWKPRVRLVFVVAALLGLALTLGWAHAASFLEW